MTVELGERFEGVWAAVMCSSRSHILNMYMYSCHPCCFKLSGKRKIDLGQVVRKAVNTNPELKVNRSINFACIKMLFTSYALCTLRLFKLKTEGQTI